MGSACLFKDVSVSITSNTLGTNSFLLVEGRQILNTYMNT